MGLMCRQHRVRIRIAAARAYIMSAAHASGRPRRALLLSSSSAMVADRLRPTATTRRVLLCTRLLRTVRSAQQTLPWGPRCW